MLTTMKICGAVLSLTGSFVALLLLLVGTSAGPVHQSEEENIFRRNGYDEEEAGLTVPSTEVRFYWIMDCGQGVGTKSTMNLHVNLTSQAPDFITYYSLDLVHQWSIDSPRIETTGTIRDLSVGSAYGLQFTFSYDETGRYTTQHSATIRVPDDDDNNGDAWPNGLALPTSPQTIVIEEDSCYEVVDDDEEDDNVSLLTEAPSTAVPLTIPPTPVVRSVPLVNDPATIPTSSSACPVSPRMGGGFLWPTMVVTVATAFLLLSGQNRF